MNGGGQTNQAASAPVAIKRAESELCKSEINITNVTTHNIGTECHQTESTSPLEIFADHKF